MISHEHSRQLAAHISQARQGELLNKLRSVPSHEQRRTQQLSERVRQASQRVIALGGLALLTSVLTAQSVQAGQILEVRSEASRTISLVTAARGQGIPVPKPGAGEQVQDLAEKFAELGDILGYHPPSVTSDDLLRFFEYSTESASGQPYKVSDDSPSGEINPREVSGRVALGTVLYHAHASVGEEMDAERLNSWLARSSGPDEHERAAHEALTAGDLGKFRSHLFAAVEAEAELSERALLRALILSFDQEGRGHLNRWHALVESSRTGEVEITDYHPGATARAVNAYAQAAGKLDRGEGEQWSAEEEARARAELTESLIVRALVAEQARRKLELERERDFTKARTVHIRISPSGRGLSI